MTTEQIVGDEERITGSQWALCPGCHDLVYAKRMLRNNKVCPLCGHHQVLSAAERLEQLLDPESVERIDIRLADDDPLDFIDTKSYRTRLAQARQQTGMLDAASCARGRIGGHPVIVVAMDFRFMGGSLGGGVGEIITVAAELALATSTPLVIVTASGGARMQEGTIALMQMAKTSQALGRLADAGVLSISVVSDPTYGGVAASYATLCDVIVAEPAARLGFAGPRVIMQTIGQNLPAGFQTAEFCLQNGMIDVIAKRDQLRATLSRLLATASASREPRRTRFGSRDRTGTEQALIRDPAQLPDADAWQVVREGRDLQRPTTLDYVYRLLTGFQELHGDRVGGDCTAIVGGIGLLDGTPVMLIGHQKGHNASELSARGFGMPTPAGYRKAGRLMRLASRLGIAIVTLVDTPGAFPGLAAEQNGQATAIAENIQLMAGLPTPIVAVVTGEGGSGGALALAVADRVLICADASYSVISPEGCAAILWKQRQNAADAAAVLGLDAKRLLELGVVDGVLPPGDVHDYDAAAERLRQALRVSLADLSQRPAPTLLAERYARYRRFGAPASVGAVAVVSA